MYDLWNIGLALLEGFALIISPCILPILPIILAGSLTGSKKRPLGIVCGFILFFSLFTFFARKLVEYSGIDLNLIRHLSYALLFLLGLIMISTKLTDQFAQFTARLSRAPTTLSAINKPQGEFIGGLLFGGLIALIWTPCAGPILATVIVQTVTQQTTFLSFLVVLAFTSGVALPMLLIAFFGRSILPSFFKTHTLFFRKLLGSIIIGTVVYMIYFESNLALLNSNSNPSPPVQPQTSAFELQEGLAEPYPAPSLGGITDWINSPPLQLSKLKGNVILIDFWTYSCINCIRTLPYLNNWYQKYHDQGLIIIGVHSPEFDFEKNLSHVKNAVATDGIHYPVALDNQFVTWQNFKNSYWPAHYLINKEGKIVYVHIGEGAYEVTENNIRYLLGLKTGLAAQAPQENQPFVPLTPETYLGYERIEHFVSPETVINDQAVTYSFPQELKKDDWALQGSWSIYPKRIVSIAADSKLRLHFSARKVFIVMGSATDQAIPVNLLLNGKSLKVGAGKDVDKSTILVKAPRLYEVLSLPEFGEGILEIQPTAPQLEIYTFTFGN